jgi:hypothetical protein
LLSEFLEKQKVGHLPINSSVKGKKEKTKETGERRTKRHLSQAEMPFSGVFSFREGLYRR